MEWIYPILGKQKCLPFHGLDGECRDQRGKYIFPERGSSGNKNGKYCD